MRELGPTDLDLRAGFAVDAGSAGLGPRRLAVLSFTCLEGLRVAPRARRLVEDRAQGGRSAGRPVEIERVGRLRKTR